MTITEIPARTNVVIVGLGTLGSMAAQQIAERYPDTSVVGFEQYGPVHTHGAFTGESRLFRVAAKEGILFTPFLQESREMWHRLEQEVGVPLLLEAGALSIGPSDSPELRTTREAAKQFGLDHEILTADELRTRYPQFRISDDDAGFLDLAGGAIRPESAVAGAQRLAVEGGAKLFFDTPVQSIEPGPDGVKVTVPSGTVWAERVIVTTGPWFNALVPSVAKHVKVRTFPLMWFIPQDISMFTADRFPGFMRDLPGIHAFGVPTLDGFSIKLCPNVDLPMFDDPRDCPRELTREQIVEASRQAHEIIPSLVSEPVRLSLHPDSMTDDHRPVIDLVHDGRVVVLGGMSGNGFKFAPVWGKIAAELGVTGHSDGLRAEFSATRWDAVPSNKSATPPLKV